MYLKCDLLIYHIGYQQRHQSRGTLRFTFHYRRVCFRSIGFAIAYLCGPQNTFNGNLFPSSAAEMSIRTTCRVKTNTFWAAGENITSMVTYMGWNVSLHISTTKRLAASRNIAMCNVENVCENKNKKKCKYLFVRSICLSVSVSSVHERRTPHGRTNSSSNSNIRCNVMTIRNESGSMQYMPATTAGKEKKQASRSIYIFHVSKGKRNVK